MSTTNFDPDDTIRRAKGLTGNAIAGAGQIIVTDGTTEVDAFQITIDGGTVSEPTEGTAEITIGGSAKVYTNASGVDFAVGDVVVINSSGQIVSTTTAQDTRPVGIVQAPIANGSAGPIIFAGYVSLVNVTASVTAGQFFETSTTAKLATANATRRTGSFGYVLTGGTSPTGLLFGVPDSTASLATGTFVEAYNGGKEGYQAHGTTGATETIDLVNGNYHSATLDANCTFTFTGATSGKLCYFELELTENGTGGYSPTWPGSVVWAGGTTPTHVTTAGSVTVYGFWTRDGGTTWYGVQAGGGGSALTIKDEGTPLATAATSIDFVGAGVTASGATAAKTVTIPGVTAAAVSVLGFVGEILISDTPSTPLVFADLLQNEAQDDLIYADTG